MEHVVIRPGHRRVDIEVTPGRPAVVGDATIGGALFRTVCNGADAVVTVDGALDARAFAEAMSAPQVARLHGVRLVVRLGAGVAGTAALATLDPLLGRFDDCRLFAVIGGGVAWRADEVGVPVVAGLVGRGFRTFLLDDVSSTWRETTTGGPMPGLAGLLPATTLYATPAARCRTVAALVHRGGLSGAERSHTEMVESLVRQGGMVHTVVPLPDDGLRVALTALGSSVDVIDALPWWMGPVAVEADTGEATTSRRFVDATVLRSLGSVGADIVLTQTSVVPHAALAAAALDLPHVWFVREFGDIDQGLVHPWGRAEFAAVVTSLSDVVVVNSRSVRDYLFGPDAADVRVLHPAPVIETATAHASPGPRPWTVSIVATVVPGKGQRDAVEALALLRDDPAPVHLALVGPDGGAERGVLEALAARLGVADRVEFRGELHDRAAAYGGTDAIAVTSHAEAFGRVPFEATAFGLPVIYADAGGPAEYMTTGRTGLAYPPGDARTLADAIRALRDDPGLGARLVAQARAEFAGPQRREAFDTGIRELFGTLTARSPRPVPAHLLGAIVADASSQLSEAHARFAEQMDSAVRAHADLARERAACAPIYAENAVLRAANEEIHARLLRSRARQLRARIGALVRRRAA